MTLAKTSIYTTSDAATFSDRKEALAHQNVIDRTKRVLAVLEADESAQADISGANDLETIAAVLAGLGVQLLEALTLPGRSGPKPKSV